MAQISVNQLALELGANPHLIRGIAIGLGIRPVVTSCAHFFNAEQADRIRRAYRERQAVAS